MKQIPFIHELRMKIPGRRAQPFRNEAPQGSEPITRIHIEKFPILKPLYICSALLLLILLPLALVGDTSPAALMVWPLVLFFGAMPLIAHHQRKKYRQQPEFLHIHDKGLWLIHAQLFIPYERLLRAYVSADHPQICLLYFTIFDSDESIRNLKAQLKKKRRYKHVSHLSVIDNSSREQYVLANIALMIPAQPQGLNTPPETFIPAINSAAAHWNAQKA